jgi:hypothetical protein
MTVPSNDKFYQWGYHNPEKDPVLPLSDEQRKIFERIIQETDNQVYIGSELLPSGEGLNDNGRFINIGVDPDNTHFSSPALYPHPNATGEPIERGGYYWSSGNITMWPNPSGEDRYSAAWWDTSGIYFSPDTLMEPYYAYPTTVDGNGATIVLFDDLDHDIYINSGIAVANTDRKYLLWANKNKNQFSLLHYGSLLKKEIELPRGWHDKKKKYVYKTEQRDYYYSHFSSANHDIIDKGFEDFSIFYSYIHYIPVLKNENELTHERVVEPERLDDGTFKDLNEIPFISNAKSVYLYSVYGNDYNFIPVLRSPTLPFPPSERDEEETEEREYNSEEELLEKFEAVSGLLGL